MDENNKNGSSSGEYGGYGNMQQLGNYTNNPESQISQQLKKREEVLNTLIKGSYSSNIIITCSELISPEKIKNIKIKSEN